MNFSRKFYLLISINLLIVFHLFTFSASEEHRASDQAESAEGGRGLRPTAATASTTRFQWVPSFNFLFKERPAEDDGHFARAMGAEIRYDSSILSRWHHGQHDVLVRSYAAAQSSIKRNVATVMLSLIYIQDGRLLIRNVPIFEVFLSGFAKNDSPIREAGMPLPVKCVGELYSRDSAYPAYLADLGLLFKGTRQEALYQSDNYSKNEDATPRVKPSKKFKAEECHSERGIAIYLRDVLLNDTPISHALLEGIELAKDPIIALIINIASYRDMCGSCQNTLLQELTHGKLFLNRLREVWGHKGLIDKGFAVVVAQSGMKEYKEEATRALDKGFITSTQRPIEFELVGTRVIHMENK